MYLNVGRQSPESFTLPDLNLPQKSGNLSFGYKFFGGMTSALVIIVCGEHRETIKNISLSEWVYHEMSEIYCNGRNVQVIH